MKFSFEVGQFEKHVVEFQWSKFLGVAKIWVDGTLVQKSRPLAFAELGQLAAMRGTVRQARYLSATSKMICTPHPNPLPQGERENFGGCSFETASGQATMQMIRGWEFEVGQQEKHDVRIEKERPVVLAALRPHNYRIFIDGELAYEHCG